MKMLDAVPTGLTSYVPTSSGQNKWDQLFEDQLGNAALFLSQQIAESYIWMFPKIMVPQNGRFIYGKPY